MGRGRSLSCKISRIHGLKPVLLLQVGLCAWHNLNTSPACDCAMPEQMWILLSSGFHILLCLISGCGRILPKQKLAEAYLLQVMESLQGR